MGQILLVRHGQASLLAEDYDQLSELGLAQARRTGAALAGRGVAPGALVSGRLRRQIRTAQGLAEGAGWRLAPRLDPGFDEYDHADLFGAAFPDLDSHARLIAQARRQPDPRRAFQDMFETALRAWIAAPDAGPSAPGRLSWRGFQARCLGALERVAEGCGEGQVAVVVTSGGVIAALCQHLLDLPDDAVPRVHNPLRNASITRILTRGGRVALGGFNDVSHLETPPGAGLLTYR